MGSTLHNSWLVLLVREELVDVDEELDVTSQEKGILFHKVTVYVLSLITKGDTQLIIQTRGLEVCDLQNRLSYAQEVILRNVAGQLFALRGLRL